jgi:hypothetical protein
MYSSSTCVCLLNKFKHVQLDPKNSWYLKRIIDRSCHGQYTYTGTYMLWKLLVYMNSRSSVPKKAPFLRVAISSQIQKPDNTIYVYILTHAHAHMHSIVEIPRAQAMRSMTLKWKAAHQVNGHTSYIMPCTCIFIRMYTRILCTWTSSIIYISIYTHINIWIYVYILYAIYIYIYIHINLYIYIYMSFR